MRSLMVIELRHSIGVWVALPIVGLVLVAASSVGPSGVDSWIISTQAATATAVLVIPVIAGVALIASSNRFPASQKRRLRESPHSSTAAVITHLAALLCWLVGAQVVGVAIFLATRSISGALDLSLLAWLIVTCLGSVFAACFTYCIGYLLPGKWWLAPVLALALYIGFLPISTLADVNGAWLYRLYFFTDDQADIFTSLNLVTLIGQGLWYLGASGIVISVLVLSLHRAITLKSSVRVVAAVLPALVGLVCVATQQGGFSKGVIQVPYSCNSVSKPEVCVAEPFASGQRDSDAAFEQLWSRLPGQYSRPETLQQSFGSYNVTPSGRVEYFYLYDLSSGYAARAVADYVQSYVSPRSCSSAEHSFASQIWTTWLTGGENPFPRGSADEALVKAANEFYSAGERSRVAWLSENWSRASDCRLTYREFSSIQP